MGLKETYDKWAFRPIMGGTNKTPRDQAEGTVAVDFLPNDYQTEVRNRTKGDKTVVQATGDDATNGTFKNATAFKYYSTLVSEYGTYKSKLVHIYNAQGTDNQKYVTSNVVMNTPGALYSTNS